jgi:hypothetical protein
MTPWEIKAIEFANCNCSYGCPCQFNALPTHGFCEAATAMEISEGRYGDVKLDGLRMGGIFRWPGAIHEGRGECQPYIDERADDRQREALLKIMSGQDTAPMATVFAVFFSTLEKVHDPIFAKIDFDVDVEARRGQFSVPNLIQAYGEPIRNPVTGAEHRARIELPDGFEYEVAEMGSGTTRAQGPVPLHLQSSHAHFARLHLDNNGVVRRRTV